jgi:hypothetical protein
MKFYPDWKTFAAVQKHKETGCIPTIYETMLRIAGVTGVDFDTFQEDFDLDLPGLGEKKNNFVSVADAVKAKYPEVEFAQEAFTTGTEKLARLDELLEDGKVVAIALHLGPFKGINTCHSMPVVGWDEHDLIMLNGFFDDGDTDEWIISRADVIKTHDNAPGGKELAYLNKWK